MTSVQHNFSKNYPIKMALLRQVLILSIVFGSLLFVNSSSLNISKEFFGVRFEPFVMKSERSSPVPSWHSYTFENLETMMKVIATRFSRIKTISVEAPNLPYVRSGTYFYQCPVAARTAEAAAQHNRQRNKRVLTVIIGVYLYPCNCYRSNFTEVQVALEAAQIANSIYQGTVEGLVLTQGRMNDLQSLKLNLEWMKMLKTISSNMDLKIGYEQDCGWINPNEPDTNAESKQIWQLQKQLAVISDFCVCRQNPYAYPSESFSNAEYGPQFRFNSIRNSLLRHRYELKTFNRDIELMWETGWDTAGHQTWQNVDFFEQYVREINKFALENNFTTWLNEAFDTPTRGQQKRGWWTLMQNDQINNVSGYLEKISGSFVTSNQDLRENTDNVSYDTKNDLLAYILTILAVVTIFVVTSIFCVLSKRWESPSFLSKCI